MQGQSTPRGCAVHNVVTTGGDDTGHRPATITVDRNGAPAEIILTTAQAAVVADELRFHLGSDVAEEAAELDSSNAAVTPESLDSLESLIGTYRRALNQIAWGSPDADVALTFSTSRLE